MSLGVVLCVCARRSMWGCLCEPGRCVCVVCVRVCVMLGSRGTSGHPDSVGVSRGSLSRCGLWLRLFRPGVQAAASGTRTRPSPLLALQQRPRAFCPLVHSSRALGEKQGRRVGSKALVSEQAMWYAASSPQSSGQLPWTAQQNQTLKPLQRGHRNYRGLPWVSPSRASRSRSRDEPQHGDPAGQGRAGQEGSLPSTLTAS